MVLLGAGAVDELVARSAVVLHAVLAPPARGQTLALHTRLTKR